MTQRIGAVRPTDMSEFTTTRLANEPDVMAPDGSAVRILPALRGGSMAHFELAPWRVSKAVVHRTVEEIWFFVGGRGRMWRRLGDRQETVDVFCRVAVTIPAGTHFQFRSDSGDPLAAVAITMPPWPGAKEAHVVEGIWVPSL